MRRRLAIALLLHLLTLVVAPFAMASGVARQAGADTCCVHGRACPLRAHVHHLPDAESRKAERQLRRAAEEGCSGSCCGCAHVSTAHALAVQAAVHGPRAPDAPETAHASFKPPVPARFSGANPGRAPPSASVDRTLFMM